MNPWALISGASSGIGQELARILAQHRFNLVLVARNESRLQEVAREARADRGVQTKVIPADLARQGAAEEIFQGVKDLPIQVLVNNAGFGAYGEFAKMPLDLQTALMQVNMVALVQLTHKCLPQMLDRRSGRILNVASVAAFLPGPTVNLYYASKAFVFSFSYALAEELQGTGITVSTLCPGTTRTEFFSRANIHMKRPWPMLEAREVAQAGFEGLMKGKRVIIPGFMNRLMAALVKCVPPRIPARVVRKVHEGDTSLA